MIIILCERGGSNEKLREIHFNTACWILVASESKYYNMKEWMHLNTRWNKFNWERTSTVKVITSFSAKTDSTHFLVHIITVNNEFNTPVI